MKHRSDPDLVRDCLSSNPTTSRRAWDRLVERYGRLVYSIPHRYGIDAADADDVFQSVFAILFSKLGTLRDQTRLSSWLITTTHRECWRIGKRRPDQARELNERIADAGQPDPEDAGQWEQQHLVRLALTRLGGRCEELLTALYRDPPPDYRTLADELGMKEGSIGPTRARCFSKLEPLLRDLGLAPPES